MQYCQITGERKEEDENKMENAVNEVCTKEAMEEAKKLIKEEAASFVVIREGKIQYRDKGIGVRPIMQVLSKDKELLKGAVIVDKMIGKAAAMLLPHTAASALLVYLVIPAVCVITAWKLGDFLKKHTGPFWRLINGGR